MAAKQIAPRVSSLKQQSFIISHCVGHLSKRCGFSAPCGVRVVTHAAAFSWELGWGKSISGGLLSLKASLLVLSQTPVVQP